MEIFRHIEDRNLSISRPVLTLGNFDGIHLGHQALLQHVVEDAKALGGHSVVLTFEPHPLQLLAPERAPRLILTHKDKMILLQSFGVDAVVIQAFNAAFAKVEAEEFMQRHLVGRLGVRKMWVGRDLRFGKGRKGRVEDLIRWGGRSGFEVGIVEPVELGGVRVSSSRIRSLIERGDVRQAERFLGRLHFVTGRVARGHQRGRQLGFPTANIAPRTEVLPLDGIYATFLEADDRLWPSVTNIGVNPTFGEGPRTVESYVFDFADDLYGRTVKLFFVQRLREEQKFSSAETLVEQMREDVRRAQEVLSQTPKPEKAGLAR
ncbi:MAG: riboflavin biosynthesis protein RibF [Deltaproteobacteria bacterium RIFCSPLOWO2_12_FULL_60_16]|nr:MAG: riboflavin biosynthesis protein RibF [Deltaproteobacteria bacterium RIFCSPLOWO2_12_FULL_60_16]